jgi:parallel beta-helix repeat protein
MSPSAPWQTAAKLQAVFNAALPGDQILLAQCGAWNAVQTTLHNSYSATDATHLSAMIANPIAIDSYRPSWCQNGVKPVLRGGSTVGDQVMNFTAGASGSKDGGYIVRNLSFQGQGLLNTGAIGLLFFPTYVVFDNITVNNFGGGGITCGGLAAYGYPDHITIINSTVTNVAKIGIGAWGCTNVLVQNNMLDNNGFDNVIDPVNRNHSIYISGNGSDTGLVATGIVIRGNTLTNNSILNGKCEAAVIVGHDIAADWLIENNLILQAPGTNGGGCWGIAMAPGNGGYLEGMDRLTIRGNKLVNVGNVGIELAACRDCLVENNALVWTSADSGGITGAIRFHHAVTSPAYTGTRLTVRNNSIYFNQSGDVTNGISITGDGTGHTVVSNLIYYGAGANVSAFCFETNLTTSAFPAWDNNSCYHFTNWSSSLATLGGWNAGTGFDAHSISADPRIAIPASGNNFSPALTTGSPAIDAGNAALSSLTDILGATRVSPDIGAYEFSQ